MRHLADTAPSPQSTPNSKAHDPIAYAAEQEEQDRSEENLKILGRLLPYLWPKGRQDLKIRVVLALICLALAKGVTVLTPFILAEAVDKLTSSEATDLAVLMMSIPIALVIAYGVARTIGIGLQQLRDALFARVGQHAQRSVSVETFQHLHKLSMRYHLERRTGGLSIVIQRGTKAIDFLLRFSMFNIFPTILELFLASALLWVTLDWRYPVALMAMVASYIWFTFAITEWRLTFRRKMNAKDTEAFSKAVDSLLNYETVKYFNNEDHESRRFDQAAEGYESAAVTSTTSLSLLNTGQAIIMNVGLVVLLGMAALDVAAGQITVGKFVLVNAFWIQLYQPLNLLGFVYREIKQSLVDMDRMFKTLDVPEEVIDREDAPALNVTKGELSFEDVRFQYEPDRPILKGVSFKVEGGKTLAVVGPSGAGKSTISRLLYRFYDIASGQVKIDGQEISQVSQETLRRSIGIVPQDTVLFNDTIRYNIRYGRPDATDAEVVEAAKMAEIHEFIKTLPEGYDSLVGERGLKLSGGEKQRVAIARTILKNPPILLLDEATSALDTNTEKAIQESLKVVSKDRTTLIIAHRLSTVIHADEIVVLDAGEVVERGTHDELLKLKGEYAQMWNRQLEAAQAEETLQRTGEIDLLHVVEPEPAE